MVPTPSVSPRVLNIMAGLGRKGRRKVSALLLAHRDLREVTRHLSNLSSFIPGREERTLRRVLLLLSHLWEN